MAHPKSKFVKMRQDNVPSDLHKKLLAHQAFMNITSRHKVKLEDAVVDVLKKGIENLTHLNP